MTLFMSGAEFVAAAAQGRRRQLEARETARTSEPIADPAPVSTSVG